MSAHAVRNARLKAAQRRWAREDRERGYTTFRGGRPYKPAKRDAQQLKENLLVLGAVLLVCICAGLAG